MIKRLKPVNEVMKDGLSQNNSIQYNSHFLWNSGFALTVTKIKYPAHMKENMMKTSIINKNQKAAAAVYVL